jgi:hypothetical protein
VTSINGLREIATYIGLLALFVNRFSNKTLIDIMEKKTKNKKKYKFNARFVVSFWRPINLSTDLSTSACLINSPSTL